jgi:hypothetical protein
MPNPVNLSELSIAQLEKLFAEHSKDVQNISIDWRRHNWNIMYSIVDEVTKRMNSAEDEAARLRFLKATLGMLRRAITSSKKFGVPGPQDGPGIIRNKIDRNVR